MSGLRRRLRISALLLTATALLISGCGGGSDSGSSGKSGGLEKTDITVGMLALPEVAPIQIGIDKGFFKAEGLNVKFELVQGGATAMPDLVSGKLDVLHSNYVSAILAAASGTAKLKVVGEAYVAKPGNFMLMTKKGSSITKIAELKGKKVGVNTQKNIATLAVSALLKTNGLTPEDVSFTEKPFPEMAGALESGEVDAAFMPEPFHEVAAGANGAVSLSDMFTGPTADFPIAGYLTTDTFAKDNPKTVAAFQRGLAKAAELAISNSAEVDAALLKYTKIDKATADLMQLGGFSTSVNGTRLQRVADLMQEFGYIPSKFDVNQLLVGGAS
ncbi:ABC transporter substrate-binding protein [Nonomuraea pusilla]|uniref:NitT/TauT family transport system substrate-binding protein n=1 Tax=Nonomuraea pusilla TaxID=46177 RepID=A0A1H8JWC6_9ACTN|nr:ABC transporter substrate-binding protein [Nonomuraea pusilla]SEN85020.1 NitT/TauT family transport system substrate-binding protein [Nonomuraea pusilla]